MRPLKIIIFEDESLLANDLKRQLQEYHFTVTGVFRKAEDGLSYLHSIQQPEDLPDLVLMDITLAGTMNGIEAARIMRSEFGFALVFLSGMSQVEVVEEVLKSNPYPFLIKPVDIHQALVSIRLAMHQRSLERRLQSYREKFGVLPEC